MPLKSKDKINGSVVSGIKKAASSVANFFPNVMKPASKVVAAVKPTMKLQGTIKPGTTDNAIQRYNQSIKAKMGIQPMAKSATAVLADAALQDSQFSMQERVPGEEARNNMETGQPKMKSYRTRGVRNEDKEFGAQYKNKAQTARGGKHYGGTIQQGFSKNRDDSGQSGN